MCQKSAEIFNINEIDDSKINEIVQFINDDLISNLTGHNRFYAFVARNSLQIIQREINLINGYEEKEIIRLEKLLNEKGNIKDLEGKVIGVHDGIVNFTIGQRKGIKVSSDKPLYVIDINTENLY